ncbi:MAG: hypothetical protein IJ920_08480, partial [Paludibacteraceae bacterium]|nr:hypothetical protein [Paludibacteraceae bacterium]
MTNKFLLNLLGFNPDLTSRQPRVDSLSLVSRQSDLLTHLGRITAILVLVLTIGVGNAWGAGTTVTYTLTAKTTVSKSGTAPTGATATVTSTGSWYTSGSDGRKNTDQMTAGKNTVLTLSGFKGYKITGIVLNMCSNSSNGKGTFSAVAGSTTIASISSATNFNTWYDNTSYGTSRRNVNVSLTNSTYEIKQDEDVVITIACVTTNSLYISSWSITYEAVGGCSNSVAVTKGSESHGSVTTIATSPVATCSATASDRRVTVTITPDECYDAPTNLTWTKSSGTVTASKQSGPTDNGDGTYSYVYQFAQNDNGAGTFGVTCTAKAAGKTVNFNAGPGSCGTSSLTETCDGSGVVLPNVTASGVCKGWTTFAGWRTSAIATADSTTTNPGTLYAAGSTYYPSSDNETLYAVFSKTKG